MIIFVARIVKLIWIVHIFINIDAIMSSNSFLIFLKTLKNKINTTCCISIYFIYFYNRIFIHYTFINHQYIY